MAEARITYRTFADGSSATEMVVKTLADGPDALDECETRVKGLWDHCFAEADSEGDEDTV